MSRNIKGWIKRDRMDRAGVKNEKRTTTVGIPKSVGRCLKRKLRRQKCSWGYSISLADKVKLTSKACYKYVKDK